jgi:hypothetical protein
VRWIVAAAVLFATTTAHASTVLTPSDPSVFSSYLAPIFVGQEPDQRSDGFIFIEFADSLFGADDQLRVGRSWPGTDPMRQAGG